MVEIVLALTMHTIGKSGWLKIGSEILREDLNHVEFFRNTIAGIDRHGNIQEFWLKPKFK